MPRGKKNDKNTDKKSATGALKRKKGKGAKYNKPSTLTFRIDGDLRQELKKIAKDQYASESSLCNKYIAQGIQQDTFARAKKVERRVAALELAQDKEGLQSAQALVEQLGALADRTQVIEGSIATLTKVLEKIQDHLTESEDESNDEVDDEDTTPSKASDDDDDADEDDDDIDDEDSDEDDEDLEDEDEDEDEDEVTTSSADGDAPSDDEDDDEEDNAKSKAA